MIEVLSGSISAAIEYGNIKKYPVLYLPIKEDIPRTNLVDPDKASIYAVRFQTYSSGVASLPKIAIFTAVGVTIVPALLQKS